MQSRPFYIYPLINICFISCEIISVISNRKSFRNCLSAFYISTFIFPHLSFVKYLSTIIFLQLPFRNCRLRVCISNFLETASAIPFLQKFFCIMWIADCSLLPHCGFRMCLPNFSKWTSANLFPQLLWTVNRFVESSLCVDQLSNTKLHFGTLECYIPHKFTL